MPTALRVRKVIWSFQTKFFLVFAITMSAYAVASGVYLLRYFYDDKLRYIFFSLHEGATALCTKISPLTNQVAIQNELKEVDYASSLVFKEPDGEIIFNQGAEPELAKTLWDEIQKKNKISEALIQTFEWPFMNKTFLVSNCRMENGRWLSLIAEKDRVLKPAHSMLVKLGTLFSILLLFGIVTFYFVAKSLTRPLGKLIKNADELGAGNYQVDLKITNRDEIGVLSDHLALLADRLQTRETELEKSTELASKDSLTGLWNRRFAERRLEELYGLARRHNHDLCLVYLDADNFKRINDTFGHGAGDEVLKDIAAIMSNNLRTTDYACRMGGEEFLVLLPETDVKGGLKVAQKLRENLNKHVFLKEENIHMTGSFGVEALLNDPKIKSYMDLINAADAKAYTSKKSGKDRIT